MRILVRDMCAHYHFSDIVRCLKCGIFDPTKGHIDLVPISRSPRFSHSNSNKYGNCSYLEVYKDKRLANFFTSCKANTAILPFQSGETMRTIDQNELSAYFNAMPINKRDVDGPRFACPVADFIAENNVQLSHKGGMFHLVAQEPETLGQAFWPFIRPWHNWDVSDVCQIIHLYAVGDGSDFLILDLPSYTSIVGMFIRNITKEEVYTVQLWEWADSTENHPVSAFRDLGPGYTMPLNPYGFMVQNRYGDLLLDTTLNTQQEYTAKEIRRVFNYDPSTRGPLNSNYPIPSLGELW